MALMTTIALAYEEPTITSIGDLPAPWEGQCFNVLGEPYCIEYDTATLQKLDLTTLTWTTSGSLPHNFKSDRGRCWYQDSESKVYCISTDLGSFKMNLDGTGVVSLNNPIDFSLCSVNCNPVTGFYPATMDFALRPGTNEVYGYGEYGTASGTDGWIYKYDIDTDTWSILAKGVNTGDADYGSFVWDYCTWRPGTNELWCGGGYPNTETNQYLLKYDVVTNTSTFYDWGYNTAGTELLFIDDILYTFGKEMYDTPYETNAYFDPSDNSFGLLETNLTSPRSYYGFHYLDGVVYIIGGQGIGWGDQTDVTTITFASQVPPDYVEPVVTSTPRDNTAGNLAYIQNIQKAKAAQSKQTQYNPIEQFILNLRAWVLSLFGHN